MTFLPLTSYALLKDLAGEMLRPGVLTNTSVSEAEYGADLKAGNLEYHKSEDGFIILKKRRGFKVCSFMATNAGLLLELPKNTLVEIAKRDKDTGLIELENRLLSAGFERKLGRIRFSRKRQVFSGKLLERAAFEKEAIDFLIENFDPLTGCIPMEGALPPEMTHALYDEKGLSGLLHCNMDSASGSVLHMAVRRDMRGKGLTKALLESFLTELGSRRAFVWVKDYDEAAKNAYRRYSFEEDGRTSAVLYRK